MTDIKKYFEEGEPYKLQEHLTPEDLKREVESIEYIEARVKEKNRYAPRVDFSKPKNFAKYGSAKEYYSNSFKYIYNSYPYDGSAKEKALWRLSGSFVDLYLFDNVYPKSSGIVTFNSSSNTVSSTNVNTPFGEVYKSTSPEYIKFFGGPHADPTGDFKSETSTGFDTTGISKANVYHSASNRMGNLSFNPSLGATVEFWMKKDSYLAASGESKVESIFNLAASGSYDNAYGDFSIFVNGGSAFRDKIIVTIDTGASSIDHRHDTNLSAGIADGHWHHYAVTVKSSGSSDTVTQLFIDGTLQSSLASNTAISEVTGSKGMVAALGALAATKNKTSAFGHPDEGWGNIIQTSFDEFRYWKVARDEQEIGRNWNTDINGGTNTDDSNTDLGVYFKFNEGVTGINTVDQTVLDYSGRYGNGTFINYTSGSSRKIQSAFELYTSASLTETKDPILYSYHPDVINVINEYSNLGDLYDKQNNSSLLNTLPSWLIEDDEENSGQLKRLTQIMSNFFDDLHIKITELNELKLKTYETSSLSGDNYYDNAIKSSGFVSPEIFANSSLIEKFNNRDEERYFQKDIDDVKNQIYQNIYNNLQYILKSKGTEKSFRNVLRCFGVDEKIVRVNSYANNSIYNFENDHLPEALRKTFINFDTEKNRVATVVQKPLFDGDISTSPFISGTLPALSSSHFPITMECEIILPDRLPQNSQYYFDYPFMSSSIMGIHNIAAAGAKGAHDHIGFGVSGRTDLPVDLCNLQLYAVREKPDITGEKSAYFHLTGNLGSQEVNLISSFSSSVIGLTRFDDNAYSNSKWNIAVRIKPEKHPFFSSVSGTMVKDSDSNGNDNDTNYTVEMYGVRSSSYIIENFFTASTVVPNDFRVQLGLDSPKAVYAGAHRNDFTGSLLTTSDIKLGYVRVLAILPR